MGVPPVKNGPHPFLFLTTAQKRFYIVGRKPKGRFFWFVGVPPVKNGPHPYLFFEDRPKCDFANQKLLCLQWKCGLGLEKALSVDARRGSAPSRWAFPGVLFIIKKMLERNFW